MSVVPADGLERRAAVGAVRVDVSTDRQIRGYAIVFDSLSVALGGFRERILPEAVNRTLREGLDVRALVDHDSSKIIGRVTAGTLSLAKDKSGLRVLINPPQTTVAADLLESIQRGDITGMSFAFRTLEDDWHIEDGEPVREVSDMVIREVSIVSFPAYEDTSVALRSLDQSPLRRHRTNTEWLRTRLKTTLAR
jgi:HK97 family phage prohead protease